MAHDRQRKGCSPLPCQADERRRQEYALAEAACWTQCPAKARRWKRVEPHGVQHMSSRKLIGLQLRWGKSSVGFVLVLRRAMVLAEAG